MEIIFICVLAAWSVGATAVALFLRRHLRALAGTANKRIEQLTKGRDRLLGQLAQHQAACSSLADLWLRLNPTLTPPESVVELAAGIVNATRMAPTQLAEARRIEQRQADLTVDLAERDRRIGYLAAELDAARAAGWTGTES